ncbi:MAG: divergent PAP2 family protein, partial [Pygmaiobacter sp.]
RAAGEQAKILNQLLDNWMNDDMDIGSRKDGKRLKELVGHTPFEVLSGALLGILMAMLFPVK